MRISFGSQRSAASPGGPISRRSGNQAGCVVLFFGVFLVMGCVFLYFFAIRPGLHWWEGRSWVATDCVIVDSRVGSSDDTYRVEVTFRYVFAGHEYTSERYQFFDAYTSGHGGKAKVVARYPPGSAATCYVDPDQPDQAVLNRGFSALALFGLLPLIFVAIGAGGIVFALRERQRGLTPTPATSGLPPAPSADGPVVLRASSSALGRFLVSVLVTLFWNSITSVFLFQVAGEWQRGDKPWGLTLFLVPFVLAGVGFVVGCGYYLLALANPRPVLTLDRAAARPGETVQLSWRLTGAVQRVERLRIVLEGREEASYRSGKSTATESHVFFTLPIADTTPQGRRSAETASFTLPPGAMHSFRADHNKIVWQLKVTGEIASWPDVDESFDFLVLP